jgi:hypothetical protein
VAEAGGALGAERADGDAVGVVVVVVAVVVVQAVGTVAERAVEDVARGAGAAGATQLAGVVTVTRVIDRTTEAPVADLRRKRLSKNELAVLTPTLHSLPVTFPYIQYNIICIQKIIAFDATM